MPSGRCAAGLSLHSNGRLDDALGAASTASAQLRRGEWRLVCEAAVGAIGRFVSFAFPGRAPPSPPGAAGEEPREREARACATLGVELGAGMAEIKAAHRKLALEHHPDKAQGRGASEEEIKAAEEKFKEVQAAYDTLVELRGT